MTKFVFEIRSFVAIVCKEVFVTVAEAYGMVGASSVFKFSSLLSPVVHLVLD